MSSYATIVGLGCNPMKFLNETRHRASGGDEMVEVTSAGFAFVAIGEDGRPRELPAG